MSTLQMISSRFIWTLNLIFFGTESFLYTLIEFIRSNIADSSYVHHKVAHLLFGPMQYVIFQQDESVPITKNQVLLKDENACVQNAPLK